jgi:hypothetical protein
MASGSLLRSEDLLTKNIPKFVAITLFAPNAMGFVVPRSMTACKAHDILAGRTRLWFVVHHVARQPFAARFEVMILGRDQSDLFFDKLAQPRPSPASQTPVDSGHIQARKAMSGLSA